MTYKSFLLIFFVICFLGSPAQAQKINAENLFYITHSKKGIESFREHADQISIIVPATYHIDKHGVISGQMDSEILDIADKHNVKVMPIIVSFDQEGIHHFLNDSSAVRRALNMMTHLAEKNNYDGWQYDLENINFLDGPAYTAFYQKSAEVLHKHDLKISMAVVKKNHDLPAPGSHGYNSWLYKNWRGAFQIKKLVQIGDFISFMTYDQHTANTPPGPVAGLPWMKDMTEYLQSLDVPMNKISLGIPTYSDYWYPTYDKEKGPHSTRSEISFKKATDLLKKYQAKKQWMSPQGVYYAHWTMPNGVFNWLFMEDTRSFKEKLKLVPKYDFRGFSVWVLGTEDPGIWDMLRDQVKTSQGKK